MGGLIARIDGELAVEFVDGQRRIMGEQEKAIEQMEIRRGWVAAEELCEEVLSALALLGQQRVSGFACLLKDGAIPPRPHPWAT